MSLSRIACFQIRSLAAQMRQPVHHVLHKMKAVQIVLHPHIERGRDGALFVVAPDMKVAVGPAVGQPVDQRGISVEAKNDVLVCREERVSVSAGWASRMAVSVSIGVTS